MTDATTEPQTDPTPPGQRARKRPPRGGPGRTPHPLLDRLAELHPALFGPRPRPLKLGTYEDLLARHPGLFDAAELKAALGQHARSSRYLECLSRGEPRHDLDGQCAGPLSLEHQHHAVVELFRRRQHRSAVDLQPALRARVRDLFIASGLDRDGYASAARIRRDTLDALLDQARQDQAGDIARCEALLRAFEASGLDEAAFAERYGLAPQATAAQLARARDERRIQAAG
ncbi:ProQ/FinO family protein [Pseudorhodoferax sp.]|uniref:ProQ/FinO family protein n=1 Tax=Pseudorhodoferax sp. TaxID=1993553 RepID=UPI0039E47540